MTLNRFAWWVAVVMLLALGGCRGEGGATTSGSAGEALSRAEALAEPLGALAARLAPATSGFVRDGALARSSGAELRAALPARADGALTAAVGPREARRVGLTLRGASPGAALELDAGRAVYREAYPATDVVVTAEPSRVEVFFVLRDATAPSAFTWDVALGAGLAKVEREASGALAFADAGGTKHLRLGEAVAVDAAGAKRAAALGWDGAAVRVELDTRGLAFPVLLDPVVETVVWELVNAGQPAARFRHALAYDSARGKVVLFGKAAGGGNDTWEWDGTNWTQRTPSASPPARDEHALAYDGARQKVVLFGGHSGSYFGDTWEWDGTSWAEPTPSTSPPARSDHALAYDSARGKVVLFGGYNGSSYLGDTWEWDGTNWAERTPSTSPPARSGHALAYDSARGKVVLFSGRGGGGTFFDDTWEWDGTSWAQRTTSTSPPKRYDHALTYDSARGRVVLFGGWNGSYLGDTWEWDGTNWAQRTPSTSPQARAEHAVAYDSARGKVVLFGGYDGGAALGDTWEWDGSSWAERTPGTSPPARSDNALAYDSARGKVVLFGGWGGNGRLGDTWEWDGASWTQRTLSTSPPKRSDHALTYDNARGKVVLFGGLGSGPFGDTWEWDGTIWAERTPGTSPPARNGHALAYDSARGKVVLFGGYNGSYLGDTWEWDGTTWTQRTPSTSPPARIDHALAYDSARGKVVLFGGFDGGSYLVDTWEWDGTSWTERTPSTSAPARRGRTLAYDSARRKVVLFGGFDGGSYLGDTWEWDGTSWTQLVPSTSPPARGYHTLAYDSARGKIVLFGGRGSAYLGDTWEYHAYGGACTSGAECDTGFCVDGVCCSTACGGGAPGDCVACSVAAGGAKDGVCGAVANGTPCDDGNVCTQTDSCQAGACAGSNPLACPAPEACQQPATCDAVKGCSYAPKPPGTPCGAAASCANGQARPQATCGGASGGCPVAVPIDCGGYACANGACTTTCTGDADCATGYACAGGSCVAGGDGGAGAGGGGVPPDASIDVTAPHDEAGAPVVPPSSKVKACKSASECASGFCVEGLCCDSACTDPCHSCALPTSPGVCTSEPFGVDLRHECGPSESCLGTCNGSGECATARAGAQCAPSTCTGRSSGVGPAICVAVEATCPVSDAAPFDCGAYACFAPVGACLTSCNTVDDCAEGYVCDTSRQCVPIEAPPAEDAGCGCRVGGAPAGTRRSVDSLLALLAGASALARRRGRSTARRETRKTLRGFAAWTAVVLLLALGGCRGEGGATTSGPAGDALSRAEALAAPLDALAARLAPTNGGFVRDGALARSGGAELRAALPARADGEMTAAVGPGEARRVGLSLRGASPGAALELDAGRAVYREAYPATDVVVTAEPSRVEAFFVLRDATAPSAFTWDVALGAGLVKVEREASGALAFADAKGAKHLRLGEAVAVDAAGTQRAAALGWDGEAVRVEVDTRGLVYPVLLDPVVETVVWELVNAGQPAARFHHALAYDSARGKVVLFGGHGGGGHLGDTWEWDGTNWTQRTPSTSPPGRYSHALAYDGARGRVVLFGGSNGSNLGDTWEWDGTNWTQRAPSTSPSARSDHALAYDSARGKVVLFGGREGGSSYLGDTWEWDGTDWTQRTPSTSPPARRDHALAYDSARGKVVLFGGFSLNFAPVGA